MADVVRRGPVASLEAILSSPEVEQLIAELDATYSTGRRGYSNRALVGMMLAKPLFGCTTWTRLARTAAEHQGVRDVLGGAIPSVDACYRFTRKLRRYKTLLDACIDRVLDAHRRENEFIGFDLAIDGTDIPAYAVGQKTLYKGGPARTHFSDPDATSGHRSSTSTRTGGWFFGYKLHMAVCVETGLPLAWEVATGREMEHTHAESIIEEVKRRNFAAESCTADSAYDVGPVYEALESRGCRPIIPLRQTEKVKKGEHKPPRCRHGEWEFKGVDYARKAAKYRCPKVACTPGSVWLKADRLHTLIPRGSKRWWKKYKRRTAVERTFGWFKSEGGLTPIRVRGLERVRLHADLAILARLTSALTLLRQRSGHSP